MKKVFKRSNILLANDAAAEELPPPLLASSVVHIHCQKKCQSVHLHRIIFCSIFTLGKLLPTCSENHLESDGVEYEPNG